LSFQAALAYSAAISATRRCHAFSAAFADIFSELAERYSDTLFIFIMPDMLSLQQLR
jgi:hypothetical protein